MLFRKKVKETSQQILARYLPPPTQEVKPRAIVTKGDIFNLPYGAEENLLVCFWRLVSLESYKEIFQQAEEAILNASVQEVFESAEHAVHYVEHTLKIRTFCSEQVAMRHVVYPEVLTKAS